MNAIQKHRYPGIQPFTAEQESIFFGRDNDCRRLLSLIMLEKLTVLFAKSGYGKSSLLNAGIAPALERGNEKSKQRFVPVFVRFNAWDGQDKATWFDRFRFHFAQKVPIPDKEVFKTRAYLPHTLWGEIKRRSDGRPQTYVLIFDQFEEFFTYPVKQQERFKHQLAELLYAEIPTFVEENEEKFDEAEADFLSEKIDAKAVISIRADRLGELHRMKDQLSAILHNRYELTALNEDQAREALENPAKLEGNFISPCFNFSPEARNYILGHLSSNASGEHGGVEAFQLQIVAQDIESRVMNGKIPTPAGQACALVQRADLPRLDNIYAEYYQRKIEELPPEKRLPARRLLEDGLLFEGEQGEARRISMDGDVLIQQFQVDKELLKTLEDTFLLRREANALNSFNYELSHDTLVQPVLAAKKERKAAEKQQRDEMRVRKLFVAVIGIMLLLIGTVAFAAWAYKQQDQYKTLLDEQKLTLLALEESKKNLQQSEVIRLQREFNEVLQRTKNEITGDEPDLATSDLKLLLEILQKSAALDGDTLPLRRAIEDIKQNLQNHEK